MQDLNDKVTGDTLSATEWNEVPTELQNIITQNGQSLTSADLNQLGKGVSGYAAYGDWYSDTGAANAVVLTSIGGRQSPPAYAQGMGVRFTAGNTNTGNTTINVNGLGVVKLLDNVGMEIAAGTLTAGVRYEAVFEQTFDGGLGGFLVYPLVTTSSGGGGGGAPVPPNFFSGYITSNNSGDPDHDLDIAPGTASDSTNTVGMVLGASLGKSIDVNWSEGGTPGAPLGGFPSALTLSADTYYRVFIIAKPDGQVDAGFDTSPGAANLLTDAAGDGYNVFRQIGWVLTDASSNIVQFFQTGDVFRWDVPFIDFSAVFTSGAAFNVTLTAPPETISNTSISFVDAPSNNTDIRALFSEIRQTDSVPSVSLYNMVFYQTPGGLAQNSLRFNLLVDSSSQIRARSTLLAGLDPDIDIVTEGFLYQRGV